MKKFLFVLMMAALALPMMAQYASKAEAAGAMNRDKVISSTPMKAIGWDQRTSMVGTKAGMITWTFEVEEDFEGWMSLDADGDGYGWSIADEGHNSSTSLCSESYSFSTGALDPDNWLISPQVTLDGVLKFWAVNESSYFADMFDVYVCIGEPTNTTDFVLVAEGFAPPTAWTEYTVDLTEFAGQEGCFAFRHHDSYNMWCVYIDDISLGIEVPPMALPENLTVDPAATTADVAWEDAEATGWNLRYRVFTPTTGYFWDFENDTELPWTSVDSDGDGYGWYIWDPVSYGYDPGEGVQMFGNKCATSASYVSSVALTPDNWLISPLVNLTGQFSFWAGGQDPSWASEVFGVYVSTDMENWTPLAENVVATSPIQQYTYSLSAYEGLEGYLAIRHYNVTDMFRLNIDNIQIGTPTEEAEWIVVEGLTEPNYTIEGLDPKTTYEVQVMGYNDEQETDWTESTIFTTAEEGDNPEDPEGHMTGYWVILIDKEGNEVWNKLENNNPDDPYQFLTNVALHYSEYGGKPLSGDMTDADNPMVPFYFMVDGVRYACEEENVEPVYGDANENPLFETENFWNVPVGYFYTVGILINPETNDLLLQISKGLYTEINEMNADKTVAGVRYYNMTGQEMQQADGICIMVTTYTDGSISAVKVVK